MPIFQNQAKSHSTLPLTVLAPITLVVPADGIMDMVVLVVVTPNPAPINPGGTLHWES